nr:hypothetical protein [Vibrio jasicida]
MTKIASWMMGALLFLFSYLTQASDPFPLSPPNLSTPLHALTSFNGLVAEANNELNRILEEKNTKQSPIDRRCMHCLIKRLKSST